MFAGKDATEEFDMLHDRKVIKKYGIDEGTVVLKGTLKKWIWQMMADAACNGCHLCNEVPGLPF